MKTDRIILSRWFLVVMLIMTFVLPPFASKGFAPSEIGNIVSTTLSNSFIKYFIPFGYIFQIITLIFFVVIVTLKYSFQKGFTAFVAVSYLIYAIVQNIAITDAYGLSFVISNIILMLLTSVMWFRDIWRKETKYTFCNITKKNSWLIAVAIFCLWWTLDLKGIPNFNPIFFFTGHVAQSLQFCPMTPIFLIVLIFCKPTISLTTYRMTAIAGSIIGFWNMTSFFKPSMIYVGLYHFPLFLISLYALFDSFKIAKSHVQRT